MSIAENYRGRDFKVVDADARLRDPNDLSAFVRWAAGASPPAGTAIGDFKRIAKNSIVRVRGTRIEPSSSRSVIVFAEVEDRAGALLGWTSTRNFAGQFRNITLGLIEPAAGAGKFSASAAWQGGVYQGQVKLIRIVDRTLDIEYITEQVAQPYLDMVAAAEADGIALLLNSGFRTYAEQKHLYDGYVAGRPGFNLAAKPGRSNHQNGIAIDIDTAGGVGSPVYDWLAREATGFGFIRTVAREAWHWEYRPQAARTARANGRHQM